MKLLFRSSISLSLLRSLFLASGLELKGQNLDPDLFSDLGNNTFFHRWRPSYHFLALAGHMNDHCGPI
jgi:hypothetical protein